MIWHQTRRRLELVLALAALTLPACNRFSSSGESILIGHVAVRSGPDQAAGIRLGEAAAMVVEAFNHDADNRIENKALTIVHGDAGTDPAGFAFQATRLLTLNRVQALIGGTSIAEVEKLISPVQAAGVILVTPSGGLPDGFDQHVWAVGLHPRERGKYLAIHAAQALKANEVATITCERHALYGATVQAFRAEFRHADRRLTHEWRYRAESEIAALVAKAAAANLKALLFSGPAKDMLEFRAQWRMAKGADIPMLFAGEEEELALRADSDRSDGLIFATAFSADDKAETVQKFVTEFRNRTGTAPSVHDVLTADAASILFAAAKKAHKFTAIDKFPGNPVHKELTGLSIDSVTGPLWFSGEQVVQRTVYVVRMEAGTAKLQKAYVPEKK